MAGVVNVECGGRSYHLPRALISSEEFMKEVVSANVWNNKLKKSDKMNLLKYLPTFSKNDTHEKKETLKKLFLGKQINFENQIKKFVHNVKAGEFTSTVKAQKVVTLLLTERKSKFTLLKRRLVDLKKIIEKKKSLGIDINMEERECMAEFGHLLKKEDPLDDVVDDRFTKIMDRLNKNGDSCKKKDLCQEYKEYIGLVGQSNLQSLSLGEVVNRCQNDSNTEDMVTSVGRKRRQLNNGFVEGLSKYARMKSERESSESQSEGTSGDEGREDENSNDSQLSSDDTDSVTSNNHKHHFRHNRHERREFRCPQEDFSSFFSLLHSLFSGAHQQKLSTAQVEERVRHWQIINQRNITIDYNDWASVTIDWVGVASSALKFLNDRGGDIIEECRHGGRRWWQWKADVNSSVLSRLCDEWRRSRDTTSTIIPVDHHHIIPAALYPTTWQTRPSTLEERLRFQAQERRRFSRPHRGFTYNVHGYQCVVSPVRGCVPPEWSRSTWVRARGHPLLISDRPPHVNIVEIVRDAVARLPNGEGSRADIVTLALDSAFWSDSSATTIGQCISSALDRLQGEGCDPSVKYNSRLKLWFYRHRHKTVLELEEMHLKNCREEMRRVGGSRDTASSSRQHSTFLSAPPPPPFMHYPQPVISLATLHPPRPSYQQFSRAVTHARDNIIHPLRPSQPSFARPTISSPQSLYPQHHHFYY